jgi:hypothetical protein
MKISSILKQNIKRNKNITVEFFYHLRHQINYSKLTDKSLRNNDLEFSLASENPNSFESNTRNIIVHDCDLYVKKSTLQMTSQDPNVMIARVFNHLPLALKSNVTEKNFVVSVKKLVGEFLFYDKAEYFR